MLSNICFKQVQAIAAMYPLDQAQRRWSFVISGHISSHDPSFESHVLCKGNFLTCTVHGGEIIEIDITKTLQKCSFVAMVPDELPLIVSKSLPAWLHDAAWLAVAGPLLCTAPLDQLVRTSLTFSNGHKTRQMFWLGLLWMDKRHHRHFRLGQKRHPGFLPDGRPNRSQISSFDDDR